LVVALVAFALKRHYADASTDALSWILSPTAHLVAVVTGVAFAAVPGEGYFSAERMFLIEKACAGVNFMIAALAIVAFALLHRARSLRSTAAIVGVSLVSSYVAAVIVNTARIGFAMWLGAHPFRTSLTGPEIHRLEGIIVYFGGLLLLYALVQRIDRGALASPASAFPLRRGGPKPEGEGGPVFRYALPLCCYYVVTLAVPLANGVQAGRAFFAHAVIVLLVPPVLILLVYAGRRLLLHYPRRSVSAGSSPHARCAGSHAAAAATTSSATAPTR
jgi:exosortase K